MRLEEGEQEQKVGVLDILRILGGVLLLNAFLSYWFTSSPTWGYKPGKYIDKRYWIHHLSWHSPLNLTIDELSRFDGSDLSLPIYVGVNGTVYDVTASRAIYGPRGAYHAFAGRDCARLFCNGCFHREDQLTYDLRGLDMEEARKDIESWQKFFKEHRNYWQVGVVIHDELVGDPPADCNGPKYPG